MSGPLAGAVWHVAAEMGRAEERVNHMEDELRRARDEASHQRDRGRELLQILSTAEGLDDETLEAMDDLRALIDGDDEE